MKNTDIIKIFNQWKNDPRLHNEILATGCMERTRIICEDLMNKGFDCGFIYFPKEEKKDESLSCVATLKKGQKFCFHWMRHVVPFVKDEQGKIIVLDVCLMDGPESFENWAKHILINEHPLKKSDVFLNSSDFLPVLEYRSKNKDPWYALKSANTLYQHVAIQPNQVKSLWLHEHPLNVVRLDANQR